MDKVEWPVKLTVKLITYYASHPCLFDTKHKFYKNKHSRRQAFYCKLLQSDVENITVEDVKKKITNIRSQFTHEHNKVKASKKSGTGTEDVYEPTVWWYQKLLFLIPYIRARKGRSSLDITTQDMVEVMDKEAEEFTQHSKSNNEDSDSDGSEQQLLATPSTSSSSYIQNGNKKRKVTAVKDPAEELQNFKVEDVLQNTVETLDSLQKSLTTPTVAKEHQIFGQSVAQDLAEIDDPEIINDTKFEIQTILYNAKKKWLAQRKSNVLIIDQSVL